VLGTRLLAMAVIGGVIVAGLVFPLVGGFGQLAAQAIGAVETTTPGVLTGQMPSVTTITDDTGAPIAYLYDQDRQVVASNQISTAMKAAIVAIEDRRFFVESGLDARGVVRALVNNSTGGST
jgi:membrane peptidoglycan carboxypeptidase